MSVLRDFVHAMACGQEVPVTLGEHKEMFRARESLDRQVLAMDMDVSPRFGIRLIQDAHSNFIALVDSGVTHGWLQDYLPGAGWSTYDPTNRLIGTSKLTRLGMVRYPAFASPFTSSRFGEATAYKGMTASVQVNFGKLEGQACEAPGCQAERSNWQSQRSTEHHG